MLILQEVERIRRAGLRTYSFYLLHEDEDL